MQLHDWLTIAAILIAPAAAIQIQVWLEHYRAYKRLQNDICFRMMTTRGTRLNPRQVEALNSIDLAFYGLQLFGKRFRRKSEEEVLSKWRAYHDHLGAPVPDTESEWAVFNSRRDDLYYQLLFSICKCVGYEYDLTHLKNQSYTPKAYGDAEESNRIIREGLEDLLTGETSIAVRNSLTQEEVDKAETLRDAIESCLSGRTAIRIQQGINSDVRPTDPTA